MKIENKQQIFEKREEIEKELSQTFKEIKSPFTIEYIKDIIYHEDGQDDLTKVIAMFDMGVKTYPK